MRLRRSAWSMVGRRGRAGTNKNVTQTLFLSFNGVPTDRGKGGMAGINKNVTHTFSSFRGFPTDLLDV